MNKIITVSGRSSSGKSTLEEMLVKRYPNCFDKVISHTSRPIRVGEVNGRDYYFVNKDEFINIEMTENVIFNGCQYGASKREFERIFELGKVPIIVVTPEGAEQLHIHALEYEWEHISIFIDAEDCVLMERFMRRFYSEIIENKSNTKILDTYLGRIDKLFSEEKYWREYFNWTSIFRKFDVETTDIGISTVFELLNLTEEKCLNKKK